MAVICVQWNLHVTYPFERERRIDSPLIWWSNTVLRMIQGYVCIHGHIPPLDAELSWSSMGGKSQYGFQSYCRNDGKFVVSVEPDITTTIGFLCPGPRGIDQWSNCRNIAGCYQFLTRIWRNAIHQSNRLQLRGPCGCRADRRLVMLLCLRKEGKLGQTGMWILLLLIL